MKLLFVCCSGYFVRLFVRMIMLFMLSKLNVFMFYHNDCHMRHCSKHFVIYSGMCYELIVAGSSVDMSCSHCA